MSTENVLEIWAAALVVAISAAIDATTVKQRSHNDNVEKGGRKMPVPRTCYTCVGLALGLHVEGAVLLPRHAACGRRWDGGELCLLLKLSDGSDKALS